jgi:hypothetical protein
MKELSYLSSKTKRYQYLVEHELQHRTFYAIETIVKSKRYLDIYAKLGNDCDTSNSTAPPVSLGEPVVEAVGEEPVRSDSGRPAESWVSVHLASQAAPDSPSAADTPDLDFGQDDSPSVDPSESSRVASQVLPQSLLPSTPLGNLLDQLRYDNTDGRQTVTNIYINRALAAKDPDVGYEDWVKALFNPKPVVQRSTEDIGSNSAAKKRTVKRQEYRTLKKLWQFNQSRLASCILDDMPVQTKLPDTSSLHEVYLDRFSRPSLMDDQPTTAKQSTNESVEPFTVDEIISIQKSLVVKSASGPDNVLVKDIKATSPNTLLRVFNTWLFLRRVPKAAKRCRTVVIPKGNTDLDDIGNWRPITIGSALNRCYCKLIDRRLTVKLNRRQKAFQPVEGCAEHSMVLQHILSEGHKNRKETNIAFLDLAKAFDTVSHHSIARALSRQGINQTYKDIISDQYHEITTQMIGMQGASAPLPITSGVKQGCPLSPKLFNCIIDELLDELGDEWGIQVDNTRINSLAFADDLALIAGTKLGMEQLLQKSVRFFETRGLKLNPRKCVTIRWYRSPGSKAIRYDTDPTWSIYDSPLPALQFKDLTKYLGTRYGLLGIGKLETKDYQPWLDRLCKAKLKPQQKIALLRSSFLGRMSHKINNSKVTKGSLLKADRDIRKAVKQILHLPNNVHTDWFYVPFKNGGLGLRSCLELAAVNSVKLLNRMRKSKDETVRAVALSESATQNTLRKASWIGLSFVPDLGETKRYQNQLIVKHIQTFGSSQQGQGHSQIKENSFNDWLSGYEPISGKDYIDSVKLITNNLPTRTNLGRGQNAIKTCRLCRADLETQSHVLQNCLRLTNARCKRHNHICNILADHAREGGYSVQSERVFISPDGCRLKPDLIIYNNNEGHIIDVCIPYENDRLNLAYQYQQKTCKYECLIDSVKLRYNLDRVQTYGFVVGARGTWCKAQDQLASKLGITTKLKQKICRRAIKGSLDIWRMFRKSLGMNRAF